MTKPDGVTRAEWEKIWDACFWIARSRGDKRLMQRLVTGPGSGKGPDTAHDLVELVAS